jgi:hypothetical protein
MSTKIKIAVAMLAGIIAGAMLVGTAVAAPQTFAGAGLPGYGMMRSLDTSRTFNVPTWAEMAAFMNAYRTSNGSIDFNRMRADVTSGTVTPPCLKGAGSAPANSTAPSSQGSRVRRSTMMRGWTTTGSSTGYGMMGSRF